MIEKMHAFFTHDFVRYCNGVMYPCSVLKNRTGKDCCACLKNMVNFGRNLYISVCKDDDDGDCTHLVKYHE